MMRTCLKEQNDLAVLLLLQILQITHVALERRKAKSESSASTTVMIPNCQELWVLMKIMKDDSGIKLFKRVLFKSKYCLATREAMGTIKT